MCRRIKESTDLKWDKDDICFAVVEDEESAEKVMKVGFKYVIAINNEAEFQEDRIKILKKYKDHGSVMVNPTKDERMLVTP